MLNDPHTNYLKNTMPEMENQFVEVIGKIPLFSELPLELRKQLFQYSKFVKLEPRERVIEQGMFDQEIFVLLQGKLNVLLNDGNSREYVIDLMEQPFTLFGERSLLGEQRGATIQAVDEVLLLGIDLSSLPDILEGVENPSARQADEAYEQNLTMYLVFASVLTRRLERLVRDQYKLKQKVLAFKKRQNSWTQEWLLARIFNQFCNDELPLHGEVREIIHRKFKVLGISNPSLLKIILSRRISTKRFYLEMVRLHTLGELEEMDDLLLELINELSVKLRHHSDYEGLFQINLWEVYQIPEMTTLPGFLLKLHQAIIDSQVLKEPFSKKEFLNALLPQDSLNPSLFITQMKSDPNPQDTFTTAYLVYLICQQCIYHISEANQKIHEYVEFLSNYNSPKQASQMLDEKGDSLIETLAEMQEKQDGNAQNSSEEAPEGTQSSTDDLLSSLGL